MRSLIGYSIVVILWRSLTCPCAQIVNSLTKTMKPTFMALAALFLAPLTSLHAAA